jgi:hypothetical protein
VNERDYDKTVEDGIENFQDLIQMFFAGAITIAILRGLFQGALRLHYTRLMLAALGDKDPTEGQLNELNRRLQAQYLLFEGFLVDLAVGSMSEKRALWRAGMYAPDRGTFIYFSIPEAVAKLMPGLPGDICLGDGLCGCYLDYSEDIEGNVSVYWVVDPIKEHCEVCLDMQSKSPFFFTREELANA